MWKRFVLLSLLSVLCACQRSSTGENAAKPVPTPQANATVGEDSERLWQGVLPCSDCLGIDTRLQLRQTGGRRVYSLREEYLGGRGVNAFDQTGDWLEREAAIDGISGEVIVLDPQGKAQQYWLRDDGSVELLDTQGHRQTNGDALRLQRMAP